MPPPQMPPVLPERMPPRPAPPTTLWETEEDSSPSSPSDHPTDLQQQVRIAHLQYDIFAGFPWSA